MFNILISLHCGWCSCERKAAKRVKKGIKQLKDDFNLRKLLLMMHDKQDYLHLLEDSDD